MKGADEREAFKAAASEKRFRPGFHFPGGFVGEGDGDDRFGRDTFVDQVKQASGQSLRFSAAGAGGYQKRAVWGGYGFKLSGVQVVW